MVITGCPYGLSMDWLWTGDNGLNLNANLSAPSYECCRLQLLVRGYGMRARAAVVFFLSIHHCTNTSPAATTTCLDARVAPSLCQGHHLSTAHAAHAAPAVVMRDAFCFFCLPDTGTHGKKQKRR